MSHHIIVRDALPEYPNRGNIEELHAEAIAALSSFLAESTGAKLDRYGDLDMDELKLRVMAADVIFTGRALLGKLKPVSCQDAQKKTNPPPRMGAGLVLYSQVQGNQSAICAAVVVCNTFENCRCQSGESILD